MTPVRIKYQHALIFSTCQECEWFELKRGLVPLGLGGIPHAEETGHVVYQEETRVAVIVPGEASSRLPYGTAAQASERPETTQITPLSGCVGTVTMLR